MNKKILTLIIASAMVLSTTVAALSVSAASAENVSGAAVSAELSSSEDDFQISEKDGKASIISYTGNDENVTIPAEIRGNKVTRIRMSAFHGNTTIKSITIPDTVTDIDEYCFSECTSLTDINIPASVTDVGRYAFNGTPWLNNYSGDFVIVGDGVLTLYKGEEKSVTIPDTVKTVGHGAFQKCSSVEYIKVPSSVTSIGRFAFAECESLKEVDIADSVTSIGYEAFYICMALEKVTIRDSVSAIGDDAFFWCDNVTIYCYADSYAQIYAAQSNIKYKIMPRPVAMSGICGDLDNDGKITASDALTILRASTKMIQIAAEQKLSGDVDEDGFITANDALAVLRYSVGVDDRIGIGYPIADFDHKVIIYM